MFQWRTVTIQELKTSHCWRSCGYWLWLKQAGRQLPDTHATVHWCKPRPSACSSENKLRNLWVINSILGRKSDVWFTVHRDSVWIRNQLDVTFVLSFISPLQVAQHVSGNHVPIFRSWWLSSVIATCWYVLYQWVVLFRYISLWVGCVYAVVSSWKRAHCCPKHVEQLVKEK